MQKRYVHKMYSVVLWKSPKRSKLLTLNVYQLRFHLDTQSLNEK